MDEIILTSNYNLGRGLGTSINLFLCAIFGKSAGALRTKQDFIINEAYVDLYDQFLKLGKGYHLEYVRVTWISPFNLSLSAVVKKSDYKREELLIANYNKGLGLWTSICLLFTTTFGLRSKTYKKKQDYVENKVKEDLMEKFNKLNGGYILKDVRLHWIAGLNLSMSALAVMDTTDKK